MLVNSDVPESFSLMPGMHQLCRYSLAQSLVIFSHVYFMQCSLFSVVWAAILVVFANTKTCSALEVVYHFFYLTEYVGPTE